MNAIVDEASWREAHAALLAKEKAMTRALDRLSAERRHLPFMRVKGSYKFTGPAGATDLEGLFEGRSQLIIYHHMLQPDDPAPCSGCSMFGDQIPHLAHLNARDVTLVFVAQAPSPQIETYKRRMGWTMPFYQSTDSFGADYGIERGFGLNVFLRTEDGIMRTYYTSYRGVETLGTPMMLLDITPYGRQEDWQDAPEGVPQDAPYQWWRLHDEYDVQPSAPSANTADKPVRC